MQFTIIYWKNNFNSARQVLLYYSSETTNHAGWSVISCADIRDSFANFSMIDFYDATLLVDQTRNHVFKTQDNLCSDRHEHNVELSRDRCNREISTTARRSYDAVRVVAHAF